MQRVRKAAHEELELITAMLEVSRLEADRVLMEKREVNIVELVAELRQETEKSVREKPGLSVEWQVAPGLPSLWTDRMKLKIVLKNLLSNAVKFTGEGTVMVDVSARDGGIEIRVTDTGLGVEPEMLSVIFQMFQQGDSLATRHFGGVGLGLYVVKQVLELLGGTVTVESEVGKGSTFRVWIPSLVGGQ
ncbi:MAG: HAMP domain-containing histidine kinase [Deltaproteobacteria bacterium]|nr:HAMP domain-containing histidine kinase [Deltaproteobacteria bacterium]